jgi:hypothetical protein
MEGVATKPLRAAVLCFEGGRQLPAQVGEDGMSFAIGGGSAGTELRVEKSGAYWFKLTDRDGLSGGDDARWDIRAVPDSPPSVTIERPTANLYVTPRATVPLRITVKDDLALHRVALLLDRSDRPNKPPAEIPLYGGPPRPPELSVGGLAANAKPPAPRTIDYRWDLAALELPPGSHVSFYAAASDYKPQTGKSEPRRLIVVTPQELQERLAARQELILAELTRVLKLQRDCHVQVASLQIRLDNLGRLEQFDLDHLQAAEINQRQVNRSLTSREDGVPMHIFTLLADLENNRIDSPNLEKRLRLLLSEIDRLGRELLPPLDRDLGAAVKSAQVRLQEQPKSATRDAATAAPLASAGKRQEQVIASLESMLGQLNQWDNYRRFQRDMTQLLRDQEELTRQTAEVGSHTLTKEPKDLSPQELIDLKVLAERQFDLARRLDRLQQEMESAARELHESDPATAENVADAVEESRRLAIGSQMRTAAGHLPENQIGQVSVEHQQIVHNLQEVLDILANRRHRELARLVKHYQEAESELATIERKQTGLRKKLAESEHEPDAAKRRNELQRLVQQQQELQQQAQRMARRLEQLLAEKSARDARQAAEQMRKAAEHAAAGNCQGAGKQAAEAEKSLQDARRQLAAQRFQAQAELAVEQMARLEDAIKHLQRQQQNVLEETQRLDQLQQAEGRLTRAQTASLRDVARLQQSVQADTVQLAEQLAGAGAFQLALAAAGAEMARAAAMLDRRQIAKPTQQAEQDALARLAMVVEALKPNNSSKPPDNPGQSGAGQGKPCDPGGVQNVAELKLAKLLQQGVNVRTRQLQDVGGVGKPLAEQQRQEFAAVGDDQGRLADLLLQMVKPVAQKPEDRAIIPEEQSPLLGISQEMRAAQLRIADNDAGLATQNIQQEIVAKIDQLIEQARKSCQGGTCQSKPQGTTPRESTPKPSSPNNGNKSGEQKASTKPVENPNATTQKATPGSKVDKDARRAALETLPGWGQLSPRQREQMLQLPPEDFLPKYQEMIEDYYRRLSQEPAEGEQP